MKENNRLIWVDSIKGWLILLVILGHAIQYSIGSDCYTNRFWNIIYSFHMPAFMAVSGYLSYRKNKPLGGIVRRFKQLVVPFVLWTLVWIALKDQLTCNTFFDYIIYPDHGLWFLWVLFLINVVFAWGCKISDAFRVRQDIILLGLCMFFIFLMVLFDIRIFGFQLLAYYLIFYSFGHFLHKYEKKIVTSSNCVIIILAMIWLVLAWFWQMHDLPSFLSKLPIPNNLISYVYRFVTALIAVYILFVLAPKTLNKDTRWNKPFKELGMLSLGIYTTHLIMMSMIVAIFNSLGLNTNIVILLAFATAWISSWLLVWLINRWSITAKLLLGKI